MRPPARLVVLPAVLIVLLGALAAPLAAAETSRRPPRHGPAPASHRVKPGETVARIAAQHRVSVASLVSVNRLSGPETRLRAGQRLTIPRAAPRAAVPPPRARRTTAAASAPRTSLPPRTLVLTLPDFSEMLPLFVWPVDGQLSSTFGRRKSGWHQGIDITAELGTPVTAAAAGVVLDSGFEGRYGRIVRIEHPNGFTTLYAHNDENLVEPGQRVVAGQRIAAVGRTGRATAAHVHFEIRQGGLAYNPLYMLPFPPRPTLTEEPSEEHDEADE